jgi:hypothetical protein
VAATHLISQLVAGKYFGLLFVSARLRMGGSYLFDFEVQVVSAFDSKVLSREPG